MSLSPGSRIGSYVIGEILGAGGMGEVYRATDTTLGREVAIKVLPEAVGRDPERLARFEREARTLASLSHPNIAVIHGFEHGNGSPALIMELVEGPTLAERIAQGAIPIDEALPIARQIVEALETAHDHGIVHRDLKPANIKLRPDGTLKVLDFGLAKIVETDGPAVPGGSHGHLTASPTITSPAMTGAGVILGTAAYMAPEQAKGQPADRRSDIWAFGCVLYEMLTGRRAFEGDDVAETLASVLRSTPPLGALPAAPPQLRLLVGRCLQKDPHKRLPHIGVARLDIEDAGGETPVQTPSPLGGISSTWWKASTVVLVLAVLGFAGRAVFRESMPPPRVTQFSVYPPENGVFESGIGGADWWPFPVLSPDGRYISFTARDSSRRGKLWVRALDELTPHALPGTEGAGAPFWSPDSRSIAFFSSGKLRRVSIDGGPARDLCDALVTARGGTWNRDDVIVFSPTNGGVLYRVPSNGGKPEPVTALAPGQTSHRAPTFLPEGRHFLYFASGQEDVSGLYVGSLDSREVTRLPVAADTGAIYAASGHLLFARQGVLYYQAFDARTHQLSGEPRPVADQVADAANQMAFSLSNRGDLTYWSDGGTPDLQMTWFDRTGRAVGSVGTRGVYRGVEVSSTGQVLVHRHDASGGDIYLLDSSGGPMKRMTFDPSQHNSNPVWSADGSQFIFQSFRNQRWGIYRRVLVGAASDEAVFESETNSAPLAWSPDLLSILFWWIHRERGASLWAVQTTGSRDPVFLRGATSSAQLSPDGSWLAYGSSDDGSQDVFLQPSRSEVGRFQVSVNGGLQPRWRADGRELFYISPFDRKLMAMKVQPQGSSIKSETPVELFTLVMGPTGGHSSGPYPFYAVSPDGQRFLMPVPVSSVESPEPKARLPITVIQNWTDSIGG